MRSYRKVASITHRSVLSRGGSGAIKVHVRLDICLYGAYDCYILEDGIEVEISLGVYLAVRKEEIEPLNCFVE